MPVNSSELPFAAGRAYSCTCKYSWVIRRGLNLEDQPSSNVLRLLQQTAACFVAVFLEVLHKRSSSCPNSMWVFGIRLRLLEDIPRRILQVKRTQFLHCFGACVVGRGKRRSVARLHKTSHGRTGLERFDEGPVLR